jgi:hypothetical protein
MLTAQNIMAPVGATATKADVQRVFKFVSGVLNGAHAKDKCTTVQVEVRRLLDTDAKATFNLACEALAQCIEQDKVPQQGLEVLKGLLSQSSIATEGSSRLGVVLGIEAPKIRVDDVQKIFQVVSGILNAATKHEECKRVKAEICRLLDGEVDATFESACDALACGIEHDKVPPQGTAVLQKLVGLALELPVSSKLASALGVKPLLTCTADDVTSVGSEDPEALKPDSDAQPAVSEKAMQEARQNSAKKIFMHVTSTLRGTFDSYCNFADLAAWHEGDLQGVTFSSACEALASAIKQGGVPAKPLQELCSLAPAFKQYDLHDTELEEVLLPHLCPKCKADACSGPQCAACKGSGRKACDACKGSGKFLGNPGKYTPPSGLKTNCKACEGFGNAVCVVCDTHPEHGSSRPLCRTCANLAVKAAEGRCRSRGCRGSTTG